MRKKLYIFVLIITKDGDTICPDYEEGHNIVYLTYFCDTLEEILFIEVGHTFYR